MLGHIQTQNVCNRCNGTGQVIDKKPVDADRNGLILKEETIKVKIPSGVEDEMELRMTGKGNDAPFGNGVAGDIHILIEEEKHQFLERDGSNIHYSLSVNISEAVLGTDKEIYTLYGGVKIKIKKGTQSGTILRLNDRGLPSINRYGKGDMLVHINVYTPENLTKEQKKFFENNIKDSNFSPTDKHHKNIFEKMKDIFS